MTKRLPIFLFLILNFATAHSQHTAIATPDAPAAIGPYSQAMQAGNMLFVSGQLAIDLDTKALINGDVSDQTRLIFSHIKNILKHAGYELKDVVKSDVYLQDLNDFAAMNAVYASFFPDSAPARSTVEAARIPKDALVEIAVIAVKHQIDDAP